MRSTAVLMLAGFLVWAIAGVRVVTMLFRTGATPRTVGDLVAWLVFLAAFIIQTRGGTRRTGLLSLALQATCALVLANSAGGTGMEIALLVMVAGQLPGHLPLELSVLWVLVQTTITFLLQVTKPNAFSWAGGIMFFGSYAAFQLFAIGAASLAESEGRAREALSAANAELERMQGLAIESARHAERLRIARDLHDSLGHRLTALGLTLEAARHLPPADVPAKIGEARDLASALMNDLRSSVRDIRDNEAPELRSLLEGLGRSVRSPRVTVEVADALRITSPEATTAFFRMGQEIVTNAARHAGASELRLTLRAVGDEAQLEGLDNGASKAGYEPGNGLIGIRERARLLGGDAEWAPAANGGFRVLARVPLARLS